ncbi:hypothetical protein V8F33_000665 [Rhypophila sp. PSN 637]
MMGVNDRDRSFGDKGDYTPLTAWRRQEGSQKLVNTLSGRKLGEDVLRRGLRELAILPVQVTPRLVDPNATRSLTPPTLEVNPSSRRISRARSPLAIVNSAHDIHPVEYSPSGEAASLDTTGKKPAIKRSRSGRLRSRLLVRDSSTPPLARLLTPDSDISDGPQPPPRFGKRPTMPTPSPVGDQDDAIPFTEVEHTTVNTPPTTTGRERRAKRSKQ